MNLSLSLTNANEKIKYSADTLLQKNVSPLHHSVSVIVNLLNDYRKNKQNCTKRSHEIYKQLISDMHSVSDIKK